MNRTASHFRESFLAAVALLSGAVGPGELLAKDAVPETLRAAAGELAFFNFDRARDLYAEALAGSAEGSARWQEAAFGLGTAAQHVSPSDAELIAEATRWFEALADPRLSSRFAPRAMMNLGRVAELKDYYDDRPDLALARARYAAVAQRFPDDPVAAEATLRLAAAFVQSYDPADVRAGVAALEQWLATHPDGPLASAMWQYLGDTYFFPLGEDRKALDAYVRADRLGWLDDADIGRVWWRMAALAERVNDPATASTYYARIVTDAPASGKAYESQVALKRLGAPVPEIRLGQRVPAATTRPTSAPTIAPATAPAATSGNEADLHPVARAPRPCAEKSEAHGRGARATRLPLPSHSAPGGGRG